MNTIIDGRLSALNQAVIYVLREELPALLRGSDCDIKIEGGSIIVVRTRHGLAAMYVLQRDAVLAMVIRDWPRRENDWRDRHWLSGTYVGTIYFDVADPNVIAMVAEKIKSHLLLTY